MSATTKIALAVASGYLLGRSKKFKLAIAVGSMLAGKRLAADPQALVQRGAKLIDSNPELQALQEQIRGRLMEAAKTAAITVATSRLEHLNQNLLESGSRPLDGGPEALEDEGPDEEEPEEEEPEEEEPDEDEPDEDEEAEDEEAEDEGAEDEGAEDEEAEDQQPRDQAPQEQGARGVRGRRPAAAKRSTKKPAPANAKRTAKKSAAASAKRTATKPAPASAKKTARKSAPASAKKASSSRRPTKKSSSGRGARRRGER